MPDDETILTRNPSPPDLTLQYGDDADQVGDTRYGARGDQLPLVVLLHGGFWKPDYDRAHVGAMSDALASGGWCVLTLEYRRIPGEPDATLNDITRALATLPSMVRQHNGQIILVGHSAGGHLALWTAATRATSALQGVLALAPVADLRLADRLHLGDGAVKNFLGTDPSERPDVDPMQLPAPSATVTIVQGATDEVVPSAVAASYCARFPGVRCLLLPDADHFALIDPLSAAWPRVVEELRALSTGII